MTVENRKLSIELDNVIKIKHQNTALEYIPNELKANFSYTGLRGSLTFGDTEVNDIDIVYHSLRTLDLAGIDDEHLILRDEGFTFTNEVILEDVWGEELNFDIVKLLIIENYSEDYPLYIKLGVYEDFDNTLIYRMQAGGKLLILENSETGIKGLSLSPSHSGPIDTIRLYLPVIIPPDATLEYFILVAGISESTSSDTSTDTSA